IDNIIFTDGKGNNDSNQKAENRFALWYMGWSSLDRRTTLPMLPWLVAEIRRKSEKNESGPAQAREVQLYLSPPLIRCVPANSNNPSVFIFEHKAQFISRFIHNSHDLSYFAYLIRSQPDNPESEMACHVFKACDPNQVPEVISSIRQVSKAALKEESKPRQDSDESFYNSQKFEVLYCGKVTVNHKKAPSTLIDDCIDKFRQHEIERKRLRLLNGQRSSTEAPVEFIMGDDPLSSSLCKVDELEPNLIEEELSEKGNGNLDLTSYSSTGSLLGVFPECILEDSDFGEQHASEPNNVQPSDADKNRTMLFQVGRFEVNLISPDTKSVVLEKNFKEISSCSQGVKQTDHFGFICRDVVESGPAQYVCYVFQCASEYLVDEVMLTLKQAFTTAAALQSSKNQIELCEACPMHDLHKLCERIEGLYPPRAKLTIQKYLSELSDNEQVNIFERVQKMKPASDHEENELVILHLRQLCETKQKSHVHIGEVPQQNASGSTMTSDNSSAGRNKLDALKNKARSSLTSSLENIISRVCVCFFDILVCICCFADHMDGRELLPLSPRALNQDQNPQVSPLTPEQGFGGEKGRRSPADYRALWKKAIHQQILLIRMEKENQRLEASRDELHIRKMKLDYQEVCQCSKEVQALWDRKLSSPCRTKVQWDKEEIHGAVCQGVPKSRRGEVWLLLSQQYRLHHRLPQRQQPPETPYQDLLKQLTAQQHAILVDLGRTFPTHQYFSTQLGAGQLSLYNLLKAYSLLDTEVGYCQGISFVAGLLLLHMSEEQAFDTLKFLMYDLGIRRQYRPDMISLQIQMYQLSRLLHDYHRNLYTHLEEHEICPSLYAAPWFLTLFASQFQLGFVARIFDLLFVQGTEVIFKVALCLLSSHEGEILECDGFESIVDYLKSTIPTLTHSQMEETITKATEMDISKQLHAYEVEYHVLQDELSDAPPPSEDSDRLDKLEKANAQLKKQNMDLLEELQAARLKIQTLEGSMESFLSRESKMKHLIRSLEQEKASYQKTIERMHSSLPSDTMAEVEMTQLKSSTNRKAKETACKKP
uniref:TBC1 domain family member 4 n=1 Tax=Sinocyclocheilus anshuiensis TaxID=1608454 RepID=A0A671PU26_9TELE